jgi:hypothetical protein
MGVEIQEGRLTGATAGNVAHLLHCRCERCPQPVGSVVGDWVAARWRGLRVRLRGRPEPLPVPAWVIEALAELDLRDAER